MLSAMKPLLSKEELADLLSPLGTELDTEPDQQAKQQGEQAGTDTDDGCHAPLVQLRVEAGRCQLSTSELLQLSRGSLLLMDKNDQDTVELYLNDQLIGQGKPVLTDNRVAIQLSVVNIPDYLRSELKAANPADPS
jgi:flagellar motor switch/type III secretory pathway protein FliN